jgi:hypothetical protein
VVFSDADTRRVACAVDPTVAKTASVDPTRAIMTLRRFTYSPIFKIRGLVQETVH